VLHMAAEGAEILLDALFVADVGIDAVKHAQAALGFDRDHQAGLGHQGKQADGLQRHCLAAGIRPGDHDNVGVFVQVYVDRHDRIGVQQRMAGAPQVKH